MLSPLPSAPSVKQFTADDALDALIEYTLASEFDHARSLMIGRSFDDWAAEILSETIYGAANILAFRNNPRADMMRDLRQLWDELNPD
jgi:hypothetical protein